jgi:hypothetical protein
MDLKSVFIIFLLVSSLIIPNSLSATENKLSLDGVWQTVCSNGLQKTNILQNKSSKYQESFFKDKNCLNESFRFVTLSHFTFESINPNWLNFTYDQIELTIFNELIIKDFNSRNVCGVNTWRLSEPQNITGKACALFNINQASLMPKSGDIKYALFKIIDTRLYYGKLSKNEDGSTPEKRPTEFNINFFQKIE